MGSEADRQDKSAKSGERTFVRINITVAIGPKRTIGSYSHKGGYEPQTGYFDADCKTPAS